MMLCVAICTYKRDRYLGKCLEALIKQYEPAFDFEIYVVDNAANPGTMEYVEIFARTFPQLNYVPEPCLGLSHARNKALSLCKRDWIVYVDDDGIPDGDFIRACYTVAGSDFDCVGGFYFPYFETPVPKWLPKGFGSNWRGQTKRESLVKGYISGGIALYRTICLRNVGGFPEHLGMRGDEIAYGEENWVVDRFREFGYKIGVDPAIKMMHLVSRSKTRMRWHISARTARFRANYYLRKGLQKSISSFALEMIFECVRRIMSSIFKILTQKGYHIENVIIDSLGTLKGSATAFLLRLRRTRPGTNKRK